MNDFKLYLKMLVATDMEGEPFLEDKNELHTLDDSYPFIFTNIKGPILVKEEDMDTYIRFELFNIDTDWLEL